MYIACANRGLLLTEAMCSPRPCAEELLGRSPSHEPPPPEKKYYHLCGSLGVPFLKSAGKCPDRFRESLENSSHAVSAARSLHSSSGSQVHIACPDHLTKYCFLCPLPRFFSRSPTISSTVQRSSPSSSIMASGWESSETCPSKGLCGCKRSRSTWNTG